MIAIRPTPQALVALAGAAYTSNAIDLLTQAARVDAGDVAARITAIGELDVVAFRGTVDIADWLRDFDAVPLYDPRVGSCHAGFLTGARAVLPAIINHRALEQRPRVLVGHSLGGALALVLGGLLIAAGQPPLHVETYGAPRAGFDTLANVYDGVSVAQYRNGNDPVPEVPVFPYRHVRPRLAIGAPHLDPIRCHFIAAYQGSIDALAPGTERVEMTP